MGEKPNIYQRIAGVMGDVQYVKKDQQTSFGDKYKFASHDHVTEMVRPALLAHGIVVESSVIDHEIHEGKDRSGNHVWLSVVHLKMDFVNIDKPDDRTSGVFIGYGVDGQDKGIGKATSYASKYGLLKTFQLPTGDDPERESINFQPANGKAKTMKELWHELKSRMEPAPTAAITAAVCDRSGVPNPKQWAPDDLIACLDDSDFVKMVMLETDKLDSEGSTAVLPNSEAGARIRGGNTSSPQDNEVLSEAGMPGGGQPPEGANGEATLTPRQTVLALCEKDGVPLAAAQSWACERLKMDKCTGSAAYSILVDEWSDVVAAVKVAA